MDNNHLFFDVPVFLTWPLEQLACGLQTYSSLSVALLHSGTKTTYHTFPRHLVSHFPILAEYGIEVMPWYLHN